MKSRWIQLWIALILAGFIKNSVAQSEVPYLALLEQRYGTVVSQNLLEVRAEVGQPMPEMWLILSRDTVQPNHVIEYAVREGRVVNIRRFQRNGAVSLIAPHRVQISPLRAFQVAEQAAVDAGVGYHWANYLLVNNVRNNTPQWHLSLFNQQGNLVGEVWLSATNGRILSARWGQLAQNQAPRNPAPRNQNNNEIRDAALQVRDGAVGVVQGVGRTIGSWFGQ